jgi:hypothetical protein
MTILFWANEPFIKVYKAIQFWGLFRELGLRFRWLGGTLEQTLEEALEHTLW